MSVWHELRAAAAHRLPAPARRLGHLAGRLAADTFRGCFRYRVTGLAAEAAFFAILSLPPLIFGLVGAIGFVAAEFTTSTVASFQQQILALASQVLNPESVQAVIAPTLSDVLTSGRYSVISIGFVLALWSGSRALAVFIDAITIMYGMGGSRHPVKARVLSFVSYLAFLVIGIVLVPLVLAGPDLVDRLLPERLDFVGLLYWPVMTLGSVVFLIGLYVVAIPARVRWRGHLPGAALSLLMWVVGSVALRYVLGFSAGSTTIYGPLAAPIAILIWLYLMSLAILVGVALNAAVAAVWPRFSGIGTDSRAVLEARSHGSQPVSPLEARAAAGMAAQPSDLTSRTRISDSEKPI